MQHYQDIIQKNAQNEQKTRLDKDTFNYFLSGQMNAIEMKNYQKEVNERFFFIIEYHEEFFGHKLKYYCYDNASDNNRIGYFDIFSYKNFAYVESNNQVHNEFPTLETIPVEWFIIDFSSYLLSIVEQKKAEQKQQEELLNLEKEKIHITHNKLNELHSSIKTKLTEDELQSISFLLPEEYLN